VSESAQVPCGVGAIKATRGLFDNNTEIERSRGDPLEVRLDGLCASLPPSAQGWTAGKDSVIKECANQ
jgi:hypothetical protein